MAAARGGQPPARLHAGGLQPGLHHSATAQQSSQHRAQHLQETGVVYRTTGPVFFSVLLLWSSLVLLTAGQFETTLASTVLPFMLYTLMQFCSTFIILNLLTVG